MLANADAEDDDEDHDQVCSIKHFRIELDLGVIGLLQEEIQCKYLEVNEHS